MEPGKLGGRELLEIIIKKWGVAYDVQLRKSKPFGEGSENVYVNIMWRYFGQKSFPMNEREYMEHLEAIGRYITAVDRVPVCHFIIILINLSLSISLSHHVAFSRQSERIQETAKCLLRICRWNSSGCGLCHSR